MNNKTYTDINEANRQIRFMRFQYDTLHGLYCNDQRIKDEYFERMTAAEETVREFRQLFKIMGLEYERVFNEKLPNQTKQNIKSEELCRSCRYGIGNDGCGVCSTCRLNIFTDRLPSCYCHNIAKGEVCEWYEPISEGV